MGEQKLEVGMVLKQHTGMGLFFNPDMEFEIIAIDNEVATVTSELGTGVMSTEGYSKYFEVLKKDSDELQVGDLVAWDDWCGHGIRGGIIEKLGEVTNIKYAKIDRWTVTLERLVKVPSRKLIDG